MRKTSIIWLIIFALGLSNVLAQTKTTAPEKQAEFKQRVVAWGTNQPVNVKLNSGEKISGRIAAIQNDFFALQSVTKDGKITSQQVNFSDINKLSAKGNAGRTAGMTALGVMAAVGAVFVMLFAIYAATDS